LQHNTANDKRQGCNVRVLRENDGYSGGKSVTASGRRRERKMSNFAMVEQAGGALVSMGATVLEIGSTKLNKNQKPYQGVTLRDNAGVQHKVTINQGSGNLLNTDALQQMLSFNISSYNGKYGVAFSGFWAGQSGQMTQTPQQNYSQPQQNYRQPAPPPPLQQAPNTDDKIQRQLVLKVLTPLFAVGGYSEALISIDVPTWDAFGKLAEIYLLFIKTGVFPSQPNFLQSDGNLPPDDDIPF